jgi:hypothetical protein
LRFSIFSEGLGFSILSVEIVSVLFSEVFTAFFSIVKVTEVETYFVANKLKVRTPIVKVVNAIKIFFIIQNLMLENKRSQ